MIIAPWDRIGAHACPEHNRITAYYKDFGARANEKTSWIWLARWIEQAQAWSGPLDIDTVCSDENVSDSKLRGIIKRAMDKTGMNKAPVIVGSTLYKAWRTD